MSKEQEMYELVESWEQSGQNQKEFCQQRGISLSRFGYWARKKKSQAAGHGFIPIESGQAAGKLEIMYPNGVRIQACTSDLGLIGRLIELGGPCSR